MGERSDQIERDIANTRSELSDNFNELEQKVKSAVDWRNQFDERPGTMLALAFGGGMLLSAILPSLPSSRKRYNGNRNRIDKDGYLTSNLGAGSGRFSSQPNYSSGDYSSADYSARDYSSSRNYPSPSSSSYSSSSRDANSAGPARRTLEALTGALASVAVNRASSYIDSFLPGFHQEFKKNKDTKSSQYPSGSYGGGSYDSGENYRSGFGSSSSYGSGSGSYSGSNEPSASRGDTYRSGSGTSSIGSSGGGTSGGSTDLDRPKTYAAGAGAGTSSENSWPKTSTDTE